MASERTVVGWHLASQVKPTFMLPALATAVTGGLLGPTVDPIPLGTHALAVGAALYTGHLVDEYVDAHVRGEEPPSVPARAIRPAVAGATICFWVLVAILWLRGAPAGAVAAVPLWVLGALHAPVLDRHPVAVTADYPVGIALAFVGGYLVQTGTVTPGVLSIGVALVTVLSGVNVAIDGLDRSFDRSIDKRTVPVVLGARGGAVVAAVLQGLAAILVVVFVLVGTVPTAALVGIPFPLVAAVASLAGTGRRAVHLQMGLVYPFAAVLVGTFCIAAGCVAADAVSLVASTVAGVQA